MPERLFLSSGNLTVLDTSSISESGNTARKTMLVSVLDHENLNGVLIEKAEGKKYHKTLVNKPIQAYLIYDEEGRPADFGGHELRQKKDADGNIMYYFATQSIGTHVKSWIETRYMPEYGGDVECILAEVELWTSRYPEYYAVVEKLLEEGKLTSSWEIDTSRYEFVRGRKKLLEFEFIGNALLGSEVAPAVDGAGIISSEVDKMLREAIEKDIMVSETLTKIEKGDCSLENEDKVVVTSENEVNDDTVVVTDEPVVVSEEPVVEEPVVSEEPVIEEPETIIEPEVVPEPEPEIASLTMYDIQKNVFKALMNNEEMLTELGIDSIWEIDAFINYPLEGRAIFSMYYADKQSVMIEVSYAVENDVVTIAGAKKVEMVFVDVAEINSLKEKEVKVVELSEKLVELSNEIADKDASLTELSSYKAELDEIKRAELEAKKLADIAELKNKYLATKMISEEEFETDEVISLALSELDEQKLKLIIADKIVEGKRPILSSKKVEVAETETQVDDELRTNISSYIGFKNDATGNSISNFIYN